MHEQNIPEDTYALGRRPEEIRRLQVQAQILNPSTRRLFEQAGITARMKVLDVGSGAGDVALLLANMIGPGGFGNTASTSLLPTVRSGMPYEYVAGTVRSLLPLILKFGIATEEDVAIDTLAERLRGEAVSQRAVVRGPDLVSAWARKASLARGNTPSRVAFQVCHTC